MDDIAKNQEECKLDSSPIGIFISHRLEDKDIATKIKSKLENDFVENMVEVHVCEETQGEKSWRGWIERTVSESRIMIFLYTVEHQEAWRWCMYEIGLFNGLKIGDCNRKVICLMNPHIKKLPSPIENMTPYVADKKGLKNFLKHLLYNKKFTQNVLIKEEARTSEIDDAFKDALNEINRTFLKCRLYIEHYDYRITIDLSADNHQANNPLIDQAKIYGDGKTMEILNITNEERRWPYFYRKFKKIRQATWLDEIKTFAEVSERSDPNDRILNPFIIEKYKRKNWWLPVVSSIERMRPVDPEGRHEVKKINVIFIPQLLSQEGLLNTLPTLIPFSKVRFHLEFDSDEGLNKVAVDEDGNVIMPHVVEMNDKCLQLYNLRRDEFEDENKSWTADKLVNRLSKYNLVEEGDMNKLLKDQERVIDDLLLKGFIHSEAWIPLKFTDNHPYVRNECHLPVIVSSQTEGDTSGRHETYLLVAYIKDFWPPDHDDNPYNKKDTAEIS
jgi:hypothetical protein